MCRKPGRGWCQSPFKLLLTITERAVELQDRIVIRSLVNLRRHRYASYFRLCTTGEVLKSNSIVAFNRFDKVKLVRRRSVNQ